MNCHGSILLVDDEETFREATCRLFERQGLDCHSASDGDGALKALHGRRFDVMVADIRMPGNPDLRVIRAAKSLDSRMSVILVTGYPAMETAIRAISLSVAAYMTKPVDFDGLLEHVKAAVIRSWRRRTLAATRARLQTCLSGLDTVHCGPIAENPDDDDLLSIGTVRTLAACLSELLEIGDRSGADWGSHNLCELLDCPQRPVCRDEIAAAIEVLRKTKETFKSKTLAELRARLEQRLRTT